jgi:hypothetical protein
MMNDRPKVIDDSAARHTSGASCFGVLPRNCASASCFRVVRQRLASESCLGVLLRNRASVSCFGTIRLDSVMRGRHAGFGDRRQNTRLTSTHNCALLRGECSMPVLQQKGRVDTRQPHLLNGRHVLCVESLPGHNSAPATPCAV